MLTKSLARWMLLGALACIVTVAPNEMMAETKEKSPVIRVDPSKEELAPPFGEIRKWLETSKLKPVSYTLVVLNKSSKPEAMLFVYEAGAYVEVLREPNERLLSALRAYLQLFDKADGTSVKSYILGVRRNGDYLGQANYEDGTFEGRSNLSDFLETELIDIVSKFQPPD